MKIIRDIFKAEWRIQKLESLSKLIDSFSISERFIFFVAVFFFTTSSFLMLMKVNGMLMTEIPTYGGSLREGVLGLPRFINPLLDISDADRDLVSLVYSGLLKISPEGKLIPDLAEKYTISENGLIYTFTLKDNAYFHDKEKVRADDVVFTIQKAQDFILKSPKRANWDGVVVEKIDDRTVKFTLKQPYAPFLENTTLGILPLHIWKNMDTEQFTFSKFNINPIGSGPYRVYKVSRNSGGIPNLYELRSFEKYTLGEPYISTLYFNFFSNEQALFDAFKDGSIESFYAPSPDKLPELTKNNTQIKRASLSRIFGVFFNQNQAPIFANKEVRVALDEALDKEKIIKEVLYGFGTVISGPISFGPLVYAPTVNLKNVNASSTSRIELAKNILKKNGWVWNEEKKVLEKKIKKDTIRFEFTLSTSNVPDLSRVAKIIKSEWEKIGAKVEIKIFDTGSLNQNVIRPRKYDTLLFGEIIGRDLDLYAFWHSSQRSDPGLNIALYANITADKILQDARGIINEDKRIEKYKEFMEEIIKDTPAVFIYSPDFIYLIPQKIKEIKMSQIVVPSERFSNIKNWYIETAKIWNIFINK